MVDSNSKPIEHGAWTDLLQKHVSDQGNVNYAAFVQDSLALNDYLQTLQTNHPNENNWSKNEQLAYWINAYNAFTVKLICDNYPVKSIKDIGSGPNIPFVNTPWDIKFIKIEDQTYDLNDIEHGIIRGNFAEPRIHFAVNCASVSCPALLNKAFEAATLDTQLDKVARSFINNPAKNSIKENQVQLSKIFSWFSGDFTQKAESVSAFINQYAEQKIPDDASLEYLDYDWNLNE